MLSNGCITFLSRNALIETVKGTRIAVTGTPGTGKTTLCSLLGYDVVDVAELARIHDCLGKVDPEDDAAPVDIDVLNDRIVWPENSPLVVDGHLSHLLPVDAIILLRCHPDTLRKRLGSREYTEGKLAENVESELIGVIAAECGGRPCLELDSEISADSMTAEVRSWVADGFKPSRPHAAIDWIAVIHGDE